MIRLQSCSLFAISFYIIFLFLSRFGVNLLKLSKQECLVVVILGRNPWSPSVLMQRRCADTEDGVPACEQPYVGVRALTPSILYRGRSAQRIPRTEAKMGLMSVHFSHFTTVRFRNCLCQMSLPP